MGWFTSKQTYCPFIGEMFLLPAITVKPPSLWSYRERFDDYGANLQCYLSFHILIAEVNAGNWTGYQHC
jgi:hypothetical protein